MSGRLNNQAPLLRHTHTHTHIYIQTLYLPTTIPQPNIPQLPKIPDSREHHHPSSIIHPSPTKQTKTQPHPTHGLFARITNTANTTMIATSVGPNTHPMTQLRRLLLASYALLSAASSDSLSRMTIVGTAGRALVVVVGTSPNSTSCRPMEWNVGPWDWWWWGGLALAWWLDVTRALGSG